MARHAWFRPVLLLLGVVVCGGRTAALGDAGKGPQYRFKPGETYLYAVTIVGELGTTSETSRGTIQFTVKSADDKQLQLTPSVSLSTQVRQQAPGVRPGKKGFGPKRLPGFIGRTRLVTVRELVIDPYGKVLKFSGETHLPLLLGTAEQLVIEPLSASGEQRWQREREVVLREDNDTKTPAKEVATYDIAGSAGSMVKIKKTYDFKTIPQAGETARVQLQGTSEIAFDTQAGLIKSGEFKGAIVVSEKNVTLRIPLTASYRLLTSEEAVAAKKEAEANRAKLLEAAKAAAALKPISDAEITRALAELQAGNFKTRLAADRLARALPVESRRAEVVAALSAALKDRDGFTRAAAAKALKTWGTANNVATFIDLLKDENIFARHAALEALGELKDAKGAEAVAQQLIDFRVRMQAAASLKAMGSVAEKALLPLLKDRDWAVRMEACKILALIGTRESLAALTTAQADANGLVASEAGKAVKAVAGR